MAKEYCMNVIKNFQSSTKVNIQCKLYKDHDTVGHVDNIMLSVSTVTISNSK